MQRVHRSWWRSFLSEIVLVAMSQSPHSKISLPQTSAGSKQKSSSALMQLLSSTMMLSGIVGCVLVVALGVSAAGGAVAGQNELNAHATQTTTAEIEVQFAQGMQDIELGNYSLAVERFHWVLEVAPDHSGAAEGLAQAEQALSQSTKPIATLVPNSSQNPDELFTEAQKYYDAGEWANAIRRFQDLLVVAPTYREDEVKEMLYWALVTLGLQYVRGERLQEGLAYLDQASDIRPLDDQAEGERHWAKLYITGRTYSDLNWPIAIENFRAIYDVVPSYRDVKDQLWQAYISYGDYFVALGGHCDAADQYDEALAIRGKDEVRAKYDTAAEECANPTPTPSPTPMDGVTLTPGEPGEALWTPTTSP
jgi:tetratricopeptide (TPR) repeat protein